MSTPSWQGIAQAKRESVLALIPEEWRIPNPPVEEQVDVSGTYLHRYLTPEEIEITEQPAEGIVKRTSSGQWTAEEVVRAFCHRAALAHQLLHCLHEIFFDAAIVSARALDAHYALHRKPIGPLHGLPVSLKDQFHVKNVETSMGYVGWIGTFEGKKGTGKEKVFESQMVRELRACGAVLYCKTSVPHTLMCGETVNNIIGYTLNPKNRRLTCGGSSGGEGALIGIRGSPLGFGTDIGGSIRIPAAFNGLYGIRPSTGRLSYSGMANSMDGQNSVLSVVGPLAPTASSLRLAFRALLARNPWSTDPNVHDIPWRADREATALQTIDSKILSFAYMSTDGIVNPVPPVARALKLVFEKLRALNHDIFPWTPPPAHAAIIQECGKTWNFDGGADCKSAFNLSGEPVAPEISDFVRGEKPTFSATEIAATNVRLRELRTEYLEALNETAKSTKSGRPVDAIICPVAPHPAWRRGKYRYYAYSMFVNALDYTSVVVPVMNVDSKIDTKDEGYAPMNEQDREVWDNYDPTFFEGAHVAVQIVGRRLEEEKMLAIAEYIGKVLHGN